MHKKWYQSFGYGQGSLKDWIKKESSDLGSRASSAKVEFLPLEISSSSSGWRDLLEIQSRVSLEV